MADDIYTTLGIDKSILKRDYIKNPVKITPNGRGSEMSYKEDLEYLYIQLNIPFKKLLKYFNVTDTVLRRWLRVYNIQKPKYLISKNNENTCLEKYGVKATFLSKIIKNKAEKTNLKKYGDKCYQHTNDYKLKVTNTCLEKYNVTSVNKIKWVKDKIKETNKIKYGSEYFFSSNLGKEIIKNKIKHLYGVENPFQNELIKNKIKEKMLKLYGVDNPSKNKDLQKKKYETMKINKTFQTSKYENEILELLKKKYSNIEVQWRNDNYPGFADFYIPEINTIIEYQGSWVHGSNQHNCHEPYDKNNPYHQKIVKLFEEKNTDGYKQAIIIWTKRDPTKRLWAKEHKEYSWIEFFNMTQFMEWYNKIKEV